MRKLAVQRVLAGERPDVVAGDLKISRSRVYLWLKIYREKGEGSLQSRPHSGRPPVLDVAAEHRLRKILRQRPGELQLSGELWSQQSLRTLLKRDFDLVPHSSAVARLLTRLGLKVGRPGDLLRRRRSPALEEWLRTCYRDLREKASRCGAVMLFLDIAPVAPLSGIELSGATPHWLLSARNPQGRLWFCVYKKSVTAKEIAGFLLALYKELQRQLIVVLQPDTAQRLKTARSVIRRLSSYRNDIELHGLPVEDNGVDANYRYDLPMPTRQVDINGLIDTLYASVIDSEPAPWLAFQAEMCGQLGCETSIVTDFRVHNGSVPALPVGMNTDQLLRVIKRREHYWHYYPLREQPPAPGVICTLSEAVAPQQLRDTLYYRHFLYPHGFVDELVMGISSPLDAPAGIRLSRGERQGPFTDRDKRLLQSLRSHLENALKIYLRFQRSGFALRALEDTSAQQQIGVVILDGSGEVIELNGAAEQILIAGHWLRLARRSIVFADDAITERFAQQVQQAIDWRRTMDHHGPKPVDIIRVPGDPGRHLGLLVQPIELPKAYGKIPFMNVINPHVLVHISDSSRLRIPPEKQLVAHLFGLTSSEALLAIKLADGNSLETTADQMGITASTARTYLQRIFGKLGVNRQSELVALILKSVALLA